MSTTKLDQNNTEASKEVNKICTETGQKIIQVRESILQRDGLVTADSIKRKELEKEVKGLKNALKKAKKASGPTGLLYSRVSSKFDDAYFDLKRVKDHISGLKKSINTDFKEKEKLEKKLALEVGTYFELVRDSEQQKSYNNSKKYFAVSLGALASSLAVWIYVNDTANPIEIASSFASLAAVSMLIRFGSRIASYRVSFQKSRNIMVDSFSHGSD